MKNTESSDQSIEMNNVSPNLLFSSLILRSPLIDNLISLGYEQMTPIQAKSLPMMLDAKDMIAQAKTGSGKTAAFGLSVLHHLHVDYFAVQALILCPTRELAEQVSQALRQLARLMPNVKILNLSGGMPIRAQTDSLKHGAHIIVGTPGRVQKHLDKGSLDISKLQTLVLDEADRMLDMGFVDAIKQVVSFCPKKRQTLLFSATYPTEIQQLASAFMVNPEKVVIEDEHTELDIEQLFYEVSTKADKFSLLPRLLRHYKPASALIFCNTKEQTTELSRLLNKESFSAMSLNGDMEQVDRDEAMIRFVNKSCTILVATDVAARGLDIKELPLVINFDIAFERDVHIHRIGRTGRAGNKGVAISISTPADAGRLCIIEESQAKPLSWGNSNALNHSDSQLMLPTMVTLCLSAGRKDKIRPGDILGALTKDAGLSADVIGKIDITSLYSYVAIHKSQSDKALQYWVDGKLKGRKLHAKRLS